MSQRESPSTRRRITTTRGRTRRPRRGVHAANSTNRLITRPAETAITASETESEIVQVHEISCIDLTKADDDVVVVNPSANVSSTEAEIIELSLNVGNRSRSRSPFVDLAQSPLPSQQPLIVQNQERAVPQGASQSVAPDDVTEKAIKCPICWDTLRTIVDSRRELVTTKCGHVFCNTCLKNALKAQKCCPNCRKRLTAKSFHPIYL